MSRSAPITMFTEISDQLVHLEHLLNQAQRALADPSHSLSADAMPPPTTELLWPEALAVLRDVRQRMDQVSFLYDMARQFSRTRLLREVLDLTVDTIWQQGQYAFVVVLLGETELGPYYYQEMRGVVDPRRFIGKQCPLPLWGELAHAVVRRLDPEEPDYLAISDIGAMDRPRQVEFPWMDREGSLIILPLRNDKVAMGALLLGRRETHGFDDLELCARLTEIAASAAAALVNAEMRQELQKRADQLLGLQLFTKSVAKPIPLPDVLQAIVKGMADLLENAQIYLLLPRRLYSAMTSGSAQSADGREPRSDLLVVTNQSQDVIERLAVTSLERLVAWIVEAGQALFLNPEEGIGSPEELYYNEVGRALLVPMAILDDVRGVIYAVAPEGASDFDEIDMVIMRTMANAAAMAIYAAMK